MEHDTPIDYQAALDAWRKEEHTPDNPVRSTGKPAAPPMVDDCVDYLAAARAWDREQKGLYKSICRQENGTRATTRYTGNHSFLKRK